MVFTRRHFTLARGVSTLGLLTILSACRQSEPEPIAEPVAQDVTAAGPELGFDIGSIDRRIDPCDDFYDFACGGWRSSHPIPADRSRWSRYGELQEQNLQRERLLVEAAAQAQYEDARSPAERRVGNYHAACIDESTIEVRGLTPIRQILQRIVAVQGADDVTQVITELHAHGVFALFDLYVGKDLRDAGVTLATLDRGTLGLPNRDDYLSQDPKSVALRQGYQKYVTSIFELLDGNASRASADAAQVLSFETALAKPSLSANEARDADAQYHLMSHAQLRDRFPAFGWQRYFAARGVTDAKPVNVTVPPLLDAMNTAVASRDLGGLRAYLRLHVARKFAPLLPRAVEVATFDFYQRQMRGTREMAPRWKRCLQQVDRDIGDDVGKMFVARYFPQASRARARTMADALVGALRANIIAKEWLSDGGRAAALAKLAALRVTLGHSDHWANYDVLEIDRLDAFGNAWRARALAAAREIQKLAKPTDRDEFAELPQTLDGFGSKQLNNACFTAGLLQPPVFDPGMDDAVNFGAIGGVMGHELTHQFDDEGRKYDQDGNLHPWWDPKDVASFEARAQCFIDEYARFHADDGTPLDGKLTLGENIADNGGLRLAWEAARPSETGPKIDDFTPAQRFFLAWAQIRCENVTADVARRQALSDEHAPGRWRVNGVVSNMPEFARSFACAPGAPMIRAKACRIW